MLRFANSLQGFTITENNKTGTGCNLQQCRSSLVFASSSSVGSAIRMPVLAFATTVLLHALHISSAMRANHATFDGSGNSTFNGRLFRSAMTVHDFTDTLRLHGAVIQSQPSVCTIDAANASYASAITAAERQCCRRAFAAPLRPTRSTASGARSRSGSNQPQRCFTDQGLDIADYDIDAAGHPAGP